MPNTIDDFTETTTPAASDVYWIENATGTSSRKIRHDTLTGALSCRVYRNSTQATTTSTLATMSYSTERWDNGNFWVIGSPTRLTIPRAGAYMVGSEMEFASGSAGQRFSDIILNATTIIAEGGGSGGTATTTQSYLVTAATMWRFAANDYIESRAYQNSGGGVNIVAGTATTANSNDFWAVFLHD